MKKRDKRQENAGTQWLEAMCELIKGGILAGASALIILVLCAALVSAGILRERWIDGAVMAACVLGALMGGLFSVKRIRKRALLVGLGVGAVLFLLLLTAGLLAYHTTSMEEGGVGILCACLCGGGGAGILGGTTKKKRRR